MNKRSEWERIISSIKLGDKITGTVTSHKAYGLYLDLGFSFPGFVDRLNIIDEEVVSEENYPPIGSMVTGVVLSFQDLVNEGGERWREISIDIRPSQVFGVERGQS